MNKTWVVMSYWYGYSDDAQFGDTNKVECVVFGDYEKAKAVSEKVNEEKKAESNFCYVDFEETVVRD